MPIAAHIAQSSFRELSDDDVDALLRRSANAISRGTTGSGGYDIAALVTYQRRQAQARKTALALECERGDR